MGWRDSLGTLTSLVTAVSYAPTGGVSSVTLGNGVVTAYTYDTAEMYRLDNKHSELSGTVLQDFTYTYDAVGNITDLVDASSLYAQVTHVMTYDDVHRLLTADATSTDATLAGSRSYIYNALGNIIYNSQIGVYEYKSRDPGVFSNPHATTKAGTQVFTYDKNGNQLTDGAWTHAWDFKNRLLTSTSAGNTVSYLYDHAGNRIKKTDTLSGVATYYIDGSYEIEGNKVRHHVAAAGIGNIATITTDAVAGTTEKMYHLTDHLGSSHVDVDDAGVVQEWRVYEPYGKVRKSVATGAYTNDYKYTGKEQDSETGLQYYGARYYDNEQGQFISVDPIFLELGTGQRYTEWLKDPQRWNAYAYSRDNPYKYVDPTGEYWTGFGNWTSYKGIQGWFMKRAEYHGGYARAVNAIQRHHDLILAAWTACSAADI